MMREGVPANFIIQSISTPRVELPSQEDTISTSIYSTVLAPAPARHPGVSMQENWDLPPIDSIVTRGQIQASAPSSYPYWQLGV
jgi:hypothetical protein